MAVTIKQVAERAKVSNATVSYVLNGTGSVTKETRQRVLDAVAELGYQPQHAARSMRGRSRTIGLVLAPPLDRLAEPAYAEVLAGLASAMAQRGYALLLATAVSEGDTPDLCLSLAQTGRVEGLVLLDARVDDARALALTKAGVAHVCADPAPAGSPYAAIDACAGAFQATQYLLSLGHRRIGLLQLPSELSRSEQQYEGYIQALNEARIGFDPELVIEAGRREGDGYHAMHELLDTSQSPTAVLAGSDDLAFGALHAIHEVGLSVGADMSLIAFDDTPLAAHTHPPLTAMHQSRLRLGEALAELLYELLQHHHSGGDIRNIILTPRLVVRQSTGTLVGMRHEG